MILMNERNLFQSGKSSEDNSSSTMSQELPQEKLQSLITLYTQGKCQEMLTQTAPLLKKFPTSATSQLLERQIRV